MMRTWLSLIVTICILGLPPVGWADSSQPEMVSLVTTDHGFTPRRLTCRLGSPYRLHIENRGKELHEFTAPAFLRTVEIITRDAVNPEGTEVVVQPGEEKDFDFVPRQAGRFPFICADHDWAGMTGEIIVE